MEDCVVHREFRKSMLGIVLAVGSIAGTAGAVVVDDFTQPGFVPQSLSQAGVGVAGSIVQTGIPAANTIGGSRQLDLEVTASPGGSTSRLEAGGFFGNLNYVNESLNESMGMVLWDADGLGLGADLTDGGSSNQFEMVVFSADSGGIDWQLDVTDTGGNVASAALTLTNSDDVAVLFSSFVGFASTDFSSVRSIKLTLANVDPGGDASLGRIETTGLVPLPVAAWAGLPVLAGLGLGRRLLRGR